MSKKILVLTVLLVFLNMVTVFAQNKYSVMTSAEGELQYFYGYTEYQISGKANSEGSLYWGSRLRFPVDGIYTGGSLEVHFQTQIPFSLYAEGVINLTNPQVSMEDEDWY